MRAVLGHFCSGLTVVTAINDQGRSGSHVSRSVRYHSIPHWCRSVQPAPRLPGPRSSR